jgi:hypothetical protein
MDVQRAHFDCFVVCSVGTAFGVLFVVDKGAVWGRFMLRKRE